MSTPSPPPPQSPPPSPPSRPPRPAIAASRRTVIKVGTRVLTDQRGRIALTRFSCVLDAAARLHRAGVQVLVVSSGAVGLGREALGLDATPEELDQRQACAAVGQGLLMSLYQSAFERLGLRCGQVLLTQSDFEDRTRYLNLRNTLNALLRRGAVPIINENDAVATEELVPVEDSDRRVFGDNDKLSALVAAELEADLLVLLTDVDGVFDRDPRREPGARLMTRLEDPSAVSTGGASGGRGGMRSKVVAAAVASRAGCHTVIASGLDPTALDRVLAGEEVGTWFPAGSGLAARRRWIAFAVAPRGALHLDAGAVDAVSNRRASLLPAGVSRVEGDFQAGDVVEVCAPDGRPIGRGVVFCDAGTARRWCAGKPPDWIRNRHALINRRHLVLATPRAAAGVPLPDTGS